MGIRSFLIFALATAIFCSGACAQEIIKLPKAETDGVMSVEKAIYERKSVRSYSDKALTLKEVGQVLWAAGGETVDGITGPTRAYPSAGGVYPLEIYLVAGKVDGLESGLYKYDWEKHSLELINPGDIRKDLASAAYGQRMITEAPAIIVVTAILEKTTSRYGEKGRTLFVPMDVGHLGQNVHLQAEAIGLSTVMVGGFKEEDVEKVLKNIEGTPVYMMPVGKKK